MILGIMESIEEMFNKLGKFVQDNYGNPIFWAIFVMVIVLIAGYVISELGDK